MKKAPKVLTRMRLSCCWGDNLDEKELNDVVDYINELEQQCKKQKEVIDKINKYLHTRGIQQCYNGRLYRGLDGLQVQVLEDILKEVSE